MREPQDRGDARGVYGLPFFPVGVLFSTLLSWCADTTLWPRVPLSLFVVWCTCVFISVLVVDFGGICMAGLLVTIFTQCSLPLVDMPEVLGIMAVMEHQDFHALIVVSGSGMCKVGFAGFASRAVLRSRYGPEGQLRSSLLSLIVRPKMLRILLANHFNVGYRILGSSKEGTHIIGVALEINRIKLWRNTFEVLQMVVVCVREEE